MTIRVLTVVTVAHAANPLDCWEVREAGNPIRVFGPANLYDCQLACNRAIGDMLHAGKEDHERTVNRTSRPKTA